MIQLDPGPGGFISSNLSYVGTLPIESPGVSARVVQVGEQRRLYVSSAKNISVYNVTDPGLPLLMGSLPIYNWENEDVAVSPDGKTILASDFTGDLYLHVISVTDLPGGQVALSIEGSNVSEGGNHTIECVDDPCDWAYGSEGKIYDLRDRANPTLAGRWSDVTGTGTSGHHVTRDASGLVWTDTTPIFALDVTNPLTPVIVARSDKPAMNAAKTAYQHNNMRPFAEAYAPRITPEEIADESLRPGEILLGEGETNFGPRCGGGSGPFASYSLKDFDKAGAAPFKPVDVFRPVSGTYDGDGNAAVNALGCSGHWFDIGPSTPDAIVTANAWYEHGTRLFEIDGKTAKISQIGYFQPVAGSASAPYWVGDEYIYTVDYARGIDILKYDASAPMPTEKEFLDSWMAKLGVIDPIAEAERFRCSLAQNGGFVPKGLPAGKR